MVKKNMTVEVSFPGIEKKSAPVRSLANFIAENSSLYFRKNNGDSDVNLPVESVHAITIEDSNYTALSLRIGTTIVERYTPVLVSGILTSENDPSCTLNVYETGSIQIGYEIDDGPAFSSVNVLVQNASDVSGIEDDTWVGGENLKITILSDQPTDKADLLDLATRKNIQIYDFNYEEESGTESTNQWVITLTDESTANKKVYISGIMTIPPPVDTHDPATIIPLISIATLVEEDHSFTLPQDISPESLVISEQPLIEVSTGVKSNISGNIRFDNMIMPYGMHGISSFNSYDISALYGKSTAGNKIAAQSEDNEYIHGFKMVAAKPGSKGNNLVAVFSPYSGDGSIQFALYDTTNSNEEPIFNVEGFQPFGTDDYLNHMSCYINDEYHSINEYIKFVYTSPFEYNGVTYKWGISDFENDVLPDYVVIHFTGGSDSAISNDSTGFELRSSAPTTGTTDSNQSLITDSATSFVIDCETYLCKTNSTLAVRKWEFISENTCDVSEIDSFIKLPITITPKINGKVNTDRSVAPSDSLFSNITGACAIPLSGKVGKYDIQLRTPTFTLCEYDIESEEFVSDHDVYYKVGVVPSDGLEETRDKIVKFLSSQCIELDYDIQSSSNIFPLSIGLLHANWQDNSYSILPPSNDSSEEVPGNYTMWCSVLDLENYINAPIDYTNLSEWMPKSMCLTLFDNSTLELKGLAYFKLCNSDGTPFDVELRKPYYACLKRSKDEIVQPYDSYIYMYMTFTDEKLDGGFVRACDMNFGVEPLDWQE